jgi:GAF domain-containing protein
MTTSTRALQIADIKAVLDLNAGSDTEQVYAKVAALVAETVGFKLLTLLRFVEETQEVERLYSSDPKAYPVGGRKQLKTINKDHSLAANGEIFLAANEAEVKHTFPDHDLIFSLGAGAVLNAPIRFQGKRLGTLNCCGVANSYGPREIDNAKILANLLTTSVLASKR